MTGYYPAGAANDPNAPWNQPDAPLVRCTEVGCEFESEEHDGLTDGDTCPETFTNEDGDTEVCGAVLRDFVDDSHPDD